MAQTAHTSTDMLTGLVGNVVLVKKGKHGTIVRSRPEHSKKKAPEQCQQNRNKFAAAASFIAPWYPFLKNSFTDYMGKKTARDAIRSYVLNQVITVEAEGFGIDYPQMLVSTGRVRTYIPVSQELVGETLQLEWLDNSLQAMAAATDVLSLVLYAPTNQQLMVYEDLATRNAGNLQLTLPESVTKQLFYAYATFSSSTKEQYAYSTFLGKFGS